MLWWPIIFTSTIIGLATDGCNNSGRKEVLKNKVIEWIFEKDEDNNPCLNIPESDIRKRYCSTRRYS